MICEQCKIQTIFCRERERGWAEREIGRDPEYKLFFLFYLIKNIAQRTLLTIIINVEEASI